MKHLTLIASAVTIASSLMTGSAFAEDSIEIPQRILTRLCVCGWVRARARVFVCGCVNACMHAHMQGQTDGSKTRTWRRLHTAVVL